MTGIEFDYYQTCKQIATLRLEIDRLKAETERKQHEYDELEARIVNAIENGGDFRKMTVMNQDRTWVGTVSVAVTRRPQYTRSRPQLVDALKTAGLNWLVKEDYNANTLYHYTNELIKEATQGMNELQKYAFDAAAVIPEALREDLILKPKFEIRVTKGA